MHLIARTDIRTPLPKGYARIDDLAAAYGPASLKSYFAPPEAKLDNRAGSRPTIPSFVAPQRQTSETAPEPVVARQKAYLASLAMFP